MSEDQAGVQREESPWWEVVIFLFAAVGTAALSGALAGVAISHNLFERLVSWLLSLPSPLAWVICGSILVLVLVWLWRQRAQ